MGILDSRDSNDPNAAADINTLSDRAVDINTVNAKGDIYVATADNTVTRLGVGADGTRPEADSAEATGVKWSAPSTAETGAIVAFGNNSTPNGYLLCDGSAVSRTTYSALFAVVGTTWGVGDGSTTFNVPDLRGMYLRGTGTHGSLTMADSNAFAGPSVGSSENDQFQGFHPTIRDTGATTTSTYVSNSAARQFRADQYNAAATYRSTFGAGDNIFGAHVSDGTNGTPRDGDETRPVSYGVKYVIKY